MGGGDTEAWGQVWVAPGGGGDPPPAAPGASSRPQKPGEELIRAGAGPGMS